MVCLDSDILIDFLRNDAKTIKLIENLKNQGKSISITSINSFELLKGIPRAKMDKNEIIDFLANFNVLNFNFDSSKKAAEIFNDLKSKGEILDIADILIASIVIAHKESFITNNLKHFNRIKELEIII